MSHSACRCGYGLRTCAARGALQHSPEPSVGGHFHLAPLVTHTRSSWVEDVLSVFSELGSDCFRGGHWMRNALPGPPLLLVCRTVGRNKQHSVASVYLCRDCPDCCAVLSSECRGPCPIEGFTSASPRHSGAACPPAGGREGGRVLGVGVEQGSFRWAGETVLPVVLCPMEHLLEAFHLCR